MPRLVWKRKPDLPTLPLISVSRRVSHAPSPGSLLTIDLEPDDYLPEFATLYRHVGALLEGQRPEERAEEGDASRDAPGIKAGLLGSKRIEHGVAESEANAEDAGWSLV